MPGAVYTPGDLAAEALYCAIDLYSPAIGLCPKTWSTSPAMVIHDLSTGPHVGDRAGFESTACILGKDAKDHSGGEIVRLKSSMNDPTTSGTFSTSPLVYYHLSRYLGSDIGVPPAVWRSMDRAFHREHIALPGIEQAEIRESSDLMTSAWAIFAAADADPASYVPTDDLFVADRSAFYGTMVLNVGDDYGPEINGATEADWGVARYADFQRTAPYLALRQDLPLAEAAAAGVAEALRDPVLAAAMGPGPDLRQIVFWMADMANLALLDFMLNQQDRYGNIDHVDYWHWVEGGRLVTRAAEEEEAAAVPDTAVLIRRTHINDNDAGLRPEYHNFARESGMLDALRHFPPGTYRQLMRLDADLRAGGPLSEHLRTSFGMSEAVFANLVANTTAAADILRAQCLAGTMRLDLDPVAFFLTGEGAAGAVDCAAAP